MQSDKLPIIVGVAQQSRRPADPAEIVQPIDMIAGTARQAAEDAEAPGLLPQLDVLAVVNIFCWSYADPCGLVAERLGAKPRETLYTTIGGNGPQWLVNELAERIAGGEIRAALIAGAEAMHSVRLAQRTNTPLAWPDSRGVTPAMAGDSRWGNSPVEAAHRALLPVHVYPLFENALRARAGRGIAAHQEFLGRFCERFARVARDNPAAWFRDAKSATEIATVSPANRMIGFPYPKFMNAIIDVDQSAALLLTSVGAAERLGIPRRKWIYFWGGADATDHWHVGERVNYYSSPAIRLAGRHALAQAGAGIADISLFDLYSCFPCAPQIAAAMLGVSADDPRPLTVTGGLAYAGGPGNNYCTHAIARMVERLREAPGTLGLVSGVGWYLTKHAIGVYGSEPPSRPQPRTPPGIYQAEIDAMPRPEFVLEANGPAEVETYTVIHDRDGAPEFGLIVGRLSNGARFMANTAPDRTVLEGMEREEAIGRTGNVRHKPDIGTNLFEFGD